ncbi:MAG: tetratricopeptide repeat protein [Elusimicrobia bacterium]|nr:tetratricopeptide repeat protein [Elusimicrobiota bacterium]
MRRPGLRRVALALGLAAAFAGPAPAARNENTKEQEDLFGAGSQLFQETTRDKVAAIEAFERFIKRFPSSPRAADAQFMIGQAYLEQALVVLKAEATAKKASTARLLAPRNSAALAALQSARAAFTDVTLRHKKSGLGASAQYRLGETFYNEKDWGNAIEAFRKVEKDYPKSYIVPEAWMGIIYADLALEQFSQAEANLFLLGETYPNYLNVPEVLYAQGIVNLHKGDYSAAEKSLAKIKTPEAQFYLGKTFLLSKRPYLAAAAFERLVRDYPGTELKEEAEFFIGDSFFLAKDYDGAITKYQRFINRYPESRLKVSALFRIGSSHFQKEAYVDARANFQAVLDRYPQDFFAPLAQYFIAESYLVNNQMREALFAYTKVITQYPETIKISPLAHYKLAWTEFQVGDYAQAAQTCSNFIALYPTNALAKNVYLVLGNSLLAMKRHSEAVTAFQRIIDLAPTSEIAEQALFSILQSQHQLKNFESILTSYQFIFRHLPPSQSKWRSLSYLYAAEAYLAMNQTDEAKSIYEMILKVYPNDTAAFYAQDGLAWVYSATGDDSRALEERQKLKDMLASVTSTFTFSGHNELGIADSMYNQKNYEDAYQLYEKFVKENPKAVEAPSALYKQAMSLYHLRYYTQAIETWQKLIAGYPKAKEVLQAVFQVADTLFRAQKHPEAIQAYKDIIAKYPKSQQLPFAALRVVHSSFNSKDDIGTIREAASLLGRFPAAPEATDALDLMEAVFERSPSIDFKAALGAIIQAKPHSAVAGEAQFRLARLLFEKKKYVEAAAEFQQFSVDYTDNAQLPKAQFLLAESYFAAQRFAEAVPSFNRFLNNFPRSEETARALFHLAGSFYSLKKHDEAAKTYQRLLEEYPESEHGQAALFNLALCYKALGKLDRAQEAYVKHASLAGPGDRTAQDSLWEVFNIQKERREYMAALDTLRRIEDGGGEAAELQLETIYRTGEIYAAMNRVDEALSSWERLREMRPASNPFRLQSLIKLGEAYEKASDLAKAAAVYEDLAKNASGDISSAARERASGLRKALKGQPGAPKPDAGEPVPSPKKGGKASPAPAAPRMPGDGADSQEPDDLRTQVMPEEGTAHAAEMPPRARGAKTGGKPTAKPGAKPAAAKGKP